MSEEYQPGDTVRITALAGIVEVHEDIYVVHVNGAIVPIMKHQVTSLIDRKPTQKQSAAPVDWHAGSEMVRLCPDCGMWDLSAHDPPHPCSGQSLAHFCKCSKKWDIHRNQGCYFGQDTMRAKEAWLKGEMP